MKKTDTDRYRSLVETVPQGIEEIDSSGTILYSNAAHHKLLGYEEGELIGTSALNLVHEGERKDIEKLLAFLVKEQPYPTPYYAENIRKDGSIIHVRVDWDYKRDKRGNVTGFIALVTDVSDMKRIEQELLNTQKKHEDLLKKRTEELERANEELRQKIAALEKSRTAHQKSERRFRSAASCTADLMWDGDVRTDSLHWYGDVDGILGYELGEFPRTVSGHFEHIHPEDRERMGAAIEEALNSGSAFSATYRIRCRDGTYRIWDERGKPLDFENNRAVRWVGSVTDITKQKEAEARLMLSEGRYRTLSEEFSALLNAIPDSLILLNEDLKIIWANQGFADLHGRNVSSLSGEACYQACCRIAAPCGNCPVMACFASGREESTRVMSSDGKIYDKRAFPVRREDSGEVLHVLEVARDVTAKVHMEEEARVMQSRMIQANKMTSLGMLVSGVAHEINNPNTYIMNNSQTASEIWKDAAEVLSRAYRRQKNMTLAGIPFPEVKKMLPQLLHSIYDGSLRIRNIVNNLKNFSRPEKVSIEGELIISKVLMTATSILERQIRNSTARYHIHIEEGLPPLRGSEQQMDQVVINLILNALQSLPDRDAGVHVSARFVKKKNIVEIRVRDEGRGIPPDALRRVTEPFFTTKLDSGGTGLGLSISQAIISDHGGCLTIKSKAGKGTTVIVELPVPVQSI